MPQRFSILLKSFLHLANMVVFRPLQPRVNQRPVLSVEHLHEPSAKLRICHIPAPCVMDLVQMAVNCREKIVTSQMLEGVHFVAEYAAADTADAYAAEPSLF